MLKLIEALANAGIPAPRRDTETFKIVRWGRNNRYWLKKFNGGYIFGDFVKGLSTHIFEEKLNGKKLKEAHKNMEEAIRIQEQMLSEVYEQASTKALQVWNKANTCLYGRYLESKKILSFGLKEHQNCLVVPLYDANDKLWTLQFIGGDGKKRFLSGGKKKGCYFTIGTLENTEKVLICEGYATGATLYECTEIPVVVAFDASNLKPVAQAIHEKHSNLKIIFCADNDCYHENGLNPGVEKARKAAQTINAEVIIPKFKDTSTIPLVKAFIKF